MNRIARRKPKRIGDMARIGGIWFVGGGWTQMRINRTLTSMSKLQCKVAEYKKARR